MNVLFATDGAEPSEHAATFIERTLDRSRIRVHVLCVNGFETAMRHPDARHYSVEEGRAFTERVAATTTERLLAAGFQTEGGSREGDEAGEIVEVARAEGSDLIVVGSGKERWTDVVTLGSVSSSVLHAGACPVLVVHEAPQGEAPVRVVVGTDGSAGARHALEAFVGVADPAVCQVTVVTAATPVALPPGGPAGAPVLGTVIDDRFVDAAREHADLAAARMREAGFGVSTKVEPGSAVRVLLDEVDRIDADLVVVGARGLGRFAAKVLGSVSDRMVRHGPATLVGR